MADIFKVTRYRFEAEIPTSGYHPGAWILALDSHKLWLCITTTYKMRILSDGDIITTISTYSRVLSGNYQWLSGLQFHATDCVYAIEGVIYNTLAQNLTHDAADETYTRIDVVYLNINSEIGILKGTPAENPSKPVIDSFTQIELTNVIIEANATAPSGITEEIVYNENIEWTTSVIIADPDTTTVNFESTVSPFVGTKCIKVTKTGEEGIKKTQLLFNTATAVAGTIDGTISLQLKISEAWNDGETVEIRLLNNGSLVGNSAILTDKNYGNTPTIDTWQFIVIPLSEFNAVGLSFDEVQIRFSYSYWGATGFHLEIDNLKLQYSGTVTPPVVAGTEILIPKLQLDAGRYYNSNIGVRETLDTLRCFWQQNSKEFLNYNPEIWMFRGKRHSRKVEIITGGYFRKLIKKWAHPPHLNGSKYVGSNYFAGRITHPVTSVALAGYHSEWEMTNIEPLQKMVIPVDQFEFIYEFMSDVKLTESSFVDVTPRYIQIIDKGVKKSSAFRFAIVIDNPNFAEDGCPKLIGEYSDSIYLTVQRTLNLDKNMTVWCRSPRSRT